MKVHKFEFPAKRITLYPLGDWHYGSRQSDVGFIQKVVDEVKSNPEARWVGMGDLIENAIIGSKSDVYLQMIPPEEQLNAVCDILGPIKDKGLFILAGNHESRTMRVAGLQPEQHISARLLVPFAGYSCMAWITLTKAHKKNRFSLYCHHNYGGGYTMGGKVNRAEKLRDIFPTVDATFSGHFHTTSRTPKTWFEPGVSDVLKMTGYDYITGSALTWDESYAEEKAKPPSTVEHIKVTFVGSVSGGKDTRQQIYEVITK